MSDVWSCCQCGAANHVANAPQKCPICGHMRSSCCPIGQPPLPGGHPYRDYWLRHQSVSSSIARQDRPQSNSRPVQHNPQQQHRLSGQTLPSLHAAPHPTSSSSPPSIPRSKGSLKCGAAPLAVPARHVPPQALTLLSSPSGMTHHPKTQPSARVPSAIRRPCAQPSMKDFWYCCRSNSKHLNNPAYAKEYCSQCGHKKCSTCTVLKS